MIVILAPTAQLASDTLSLDNPPALTVEAEYGAFVCEGSRYTAAHHQPVGSDYVGRHVVEGGRPAPCNDENIPVLSENEVALVSHLDLDTIGGLMRASGKYEACFSENAEFWNLAEINDVKGVHMVDENHSFYICLRGIQKEIQEKLPNTPRDANSDVTEFVSSISDYISEALKTPQKGANFEQGLSFVQDELDLNFDTFETITPLTLIVRRSKEGAFCNHLYNEPHGIAGLGVIAYNEKYKSITLSLAEPIKGISCREIVQELWGNEAGGHDGIAGSPRNMPMTEAQFYQAVSYFTDRLVGVLY